MANIEVDFDVFKKLTFMRETEETTYNDVLRDLLELPVYKVRVQSASGWRSKNVFLPDGTDLRATQNGKNYDAKIENGSIVFGGKKFKSLSGAACAATGNSTNGWTFWDAKFPGKPIWQNCTSLRK